MTTLLLLRHAQAEPLTTTDHSRPLTPYGQQQATQVAHMLRDKGLLPQVVLSSDSVRTRQTWNIIQTTLAAENSEFAPPVFYHSDLYDGGINDVVGYAASVRTPSEVVMVIGHEPVMSGTAARLARPNSDPALIAQVRVGIPTATLCVLHLDSITDLQGEELGRHQALLQQVTTPAQHVH